MHMVRQILAIMQGGLVSRGRYRRRPLPGTSARTAAVERLDGYVSIPRPPRGRRRADGAPAEVFEAGLLTRVHRQAVEVLPHPRTGAPLVVPDGREGARRYVFQKVSLQVSM
jgi:hypothetical protein